MMVLVTYDVNTETLEGRRRLRHVAKECQNFGQRVQNSVFECLIDPAQWTMLKNKLVGLIDPDKDSLRFYFLGRIGNGGLNIKGPSRRMTRKAR